MNEFFAELHVGFCNLGVGFWLRPAVAAYLGESLLFERSEPENAQAKVGFALRSEQ